MGGNVRELIRGGDSGGGTNGGGKKWSIASFKTVSKIQESVRKIRRHAAEVGPWNWDAALKHNTTCSDKKQHTQWSSKS